MISISRCSRLASVRTALTWIHPVDGSLLLFMAILLLQSAFSIFFPAPANSPAGEIDVIVRTSSAAIFGYFLSANFVSRTSPHGNGVSVGASSPTDVPSSPASGPTSRIGFSAAASSEQEGGIRLAQSPLLAQPPDSRCLQVAAATGIGLFCLLVLLLYRNLGVMDIRPADLDSVSAIVVQFRDFVSVCIGFLIGFPTASGRQTSP